MYSSRVWLSQVIIHMHALITLGSRSAVAGAVEPGPGLSCAQAKPSPQSLCFCGIAMLEAACSLFLNSQVFSKRAELVFSCLVSRFIITGTSYDFLSFHARHCRPFLHFLCWQ